MMPAPSPTSGSLVVRAVVAHPLVALWALAATTRLVALARTGPLEGGDTASYRAAAEALRASPFGAGAAFEGLPPLLPTLMAAIPSGVVLAVLLSLIGAFVAPLCWSAAAPHYGRAAAWMAGGIAAVEPSFVQWSVYLLTDGLGVALFAFALERTSIQLTAPRRSRAVVAGLAAGLGLLTRAAAAPLVLVLAVAHALVPLGARRGLALRGLALFALGVLIAFAPYVARNVTAVHEPVVYRGRTWLQLWAGTRWNEVGRGTTGVDLIYPSDYDAWSAERLDAFLRDEFLSFIRERPAEWAALAARKAVWFWAPFYPEWSPAHKVFATLVFVPLYALAVVGAIQWRRSRLTWLLVGCAAAVQLTVMATIVDYDARYRLPAELCLLPLAGAGLAALAARVRGRAPASQETR